MFVRFCGLAYYSGWLNPVVNIKAYLLVNSVYRKRYVIIELTCIGGELCFNCRLLLLG